MSARTQRIWQARATMIAGVLALIAAKFWLIANEEISGSATRYDALWFLHSAKHWYWGASYDWLAFVRPPSYALWLASTRWLGIPQRIAIEALQLGSYLFLLYALRRAGLPRLACLLAFAVACFHPTSFQLDNYTLADPFYAAALLFVLGGMILLLVEAKWWQAVATGLALAVLWNAREESFLVTLLVLAFLALWFWCAKNFRKILPAAILMLAIFGALVLAVYVANYRTYRAFAKSDMTAPSFEAAFNALNRIDAKSAQRYIPIPAESLREAFRVSPAFARLRPQLEGAVGNDWREETFKRLGIRNEIGVNWLLWALREAANREGIYKNPRTANRFFRTVAREIDQAARVGKVKTRFVWASFIGPVFFENVQFLPSSLGRILKVFVTPNEMTRDRNDFILTPEERALYDEITLRRSAERLAYQPNELQRRVENWIGENYRWLVYSLGLLGLAALCVLFFKRDSVAPPARKAALLLILCAISTRVLLFTVLTTTSWPCDYDRFLFPVMPLANVFLIALIAVAAERFRARRSTTR